MNRSSTRSSLSKTLGCAAYTHVRSHEYGKLGPKKKNIFIRYSEQSKGYVFISEHESGSVTEFESWDITFLVKTYLFMKLRIIWINDELVSHKSQNELVSPESPLHDQSGSDIHDPSGCKIYDPNKELVPQPKSQLRRSNRVGIPRRRFDIEWEAFMILP